MSVKAIAVNPNAPSTFIEIMQPMPQPGEHDLLVEVKVSPSTQLIQKSMPVSRKPA